MVLWAQLIQLADVTYADNGRDDDGDGSGDNYQTITTPTAYCYNAQCCLYSEIVTSLELLVSVTVSLPLFVSTDYLRSRMIVATVSCLLRVTMLRSGFISMLLVVLL